MALLGARGQGHQYLGGLRPDVISFSQAMGKGSWHWALQHYAKATEMAVQPEAWRENMMILRWSYGVLYLMWGQSWEAMMTYEKIWEVKLIWVDIVHGTYLFWVVSSWICWCMRSMNAYVVLLPSHLPSSWSSNLVNLASCHFDFLDALGKRKNAQTKPPSRKITSSAQSKDLQMFNILLAALCSTGARWARAFDLLRLRCQAEPWR